MRLASGGSEILAETDPALRSEAWNTGPERIPADGIRTFVEAGFGALLRLLADRDQPHVFAALAAVQNRIRFRSHGVLHQREEKSSALFRVPMELPKQPVG